MLFMCHNFHKWLHFRWNKYIPTYLLVPILDILFRQITTFIKVSAAFIVWAQDHIIERFH